MSPTMPLHESAGLPRGLFDRRKFPEAYDRAMSFLAELRREPGER